MDGRYGFDLWTPEHGVSHSFCYCGIEDACYARRFEIRSRIAEIASRLVDCSHP